MDEKRINLEEILDECIDWENFSYRNPTTAWYIINAMKDAINQALELASEKAKIKFVSDEKDLLNGGYNCIDKQSILNVINLIE